MKLVRDTWLVFSRQMTLVLRNPIWIIVGLTQPLFFLLLFAPLLRPLFGDDAYQIFIPGLLIQLAIFGTMFVGFALIAELRQGVIERMRVTPVSRLALLLGRCLRDIVQLLVQAVALVLLAIPFGLSVQVENLLLTLALLAIIALLCSAVSYGIALALRSEDALGPLVNAVSVPLLLLSGILLPLSYAPGWLQNIADLNPFSWAVTAARELFAGNTGADTVWQALLIVGTIAFAGVAWAARAFARGIR